MRFHPARRSSARLACPQSHRPASTLLSSPTAQRRTRSSFPRQCGDRPRQTTPHPDRHHSPTPCKSRPEWMSLSTNCTRRTPADPDQPSQRPGPAPGTLSAPDKKRQQGGAQSTAVCRKTVSQLRFLALQPPTRFPITHRLYPPATKPARSARNRRPPRCAGSPHPDRIADQGGLPRLADILLHHRQAVPHLLRRLTEDQQRLRRLSPGIGLAKDSHRVDGLCPLVLLGNVDTRIAILAVPIDANRAGPGEE